MTPAQPNPDRAVDPAEFVTTRWTQVIAARGDSAEARQALSDLCAAYYGPVVAFLRREGREEDAARELAHEFFARVLQGSAFDRADPGRGRFRSYLLGALKHFLAGRRVHDRREKRGAGVPSLPLPTEAAAAGDPATLAADVPVPDTVFDREWAVNLLNLALGVMQQEAAGAGALREFETLRPWLTGDQAGRVVASVAGQLGLSEGAMRVAVHRLRRRFRDLVKAEIARTVNHPDDAADELRHLLAALSS
jgi:RNA polymerase sigma-70 factor (ECF subfamily)